MYSGVGGKSWRSSSSRAMISGSRLSTLFLSMMATVASIYVAGRLWQDAQNRVDMIRELDKLTGKGRSAVSVDDTLKLITCRQNKQRLSALQKELASAKREGFRSNSDLDVDGPDLKRNYLFVIGVLTDFASKNNRNAVRKAWMGTGNLKKWENEKSVIARFIIGRSENRGDEQDRSIDSESRATNDIAIMEDYVEKENQHSKKTKMFFAFAAERWDAEFYVKVKDNTFVDIDALGATLSANLKFPRSYIGCMKSGEVFSESGQMWYEPDWWKFGDKKTYFRHAGGEIFAVSRALAKFVSINKAVLRTYAHDDVSAGSWFIGLDTKHVDERKFCCSSWSTGAICSGV